MNYIVFDLEWNQPYCPEATVKEPVLLSGEIVEIGAAKMNEQFQVVDSLRLYVKPVYYTKLHRKIASLTGIRDKVLEQEGLPFPRAWEAWEAFCGPDYELMTWGPDDVPMLMDNLALHGLTPSPMPVWYDLQQVFGQEIMRTRRQYSLTAAMEILHETGGPAHDAQNDAENTAAICGHLDLEEYLREYGTMVFCDMPLSRLTDLSRRVWPSPEEAARDPALHSFRCPWCGAEMELEPWLPLRGRQLMARAVCPKCDDFLLGVQLTAPGKDWHAKRYLYEMSDDLWELYEDRLEEEKQV